jgi:hypothetical protein
MRDLTSIYQKLLQVLYPPKGNGTNQLLRSVLIKYGRLGANVQGLGFMGSFGDLLIACYCALYRRESAGEVVNLEPDMQSPPEQSMNVFSLVISLVTIGSVVITVNSKLLGGKV